MKALVAGTPLESMVWQSDLGKVRFRWRDMPAQQRAKFLSDLIQSAAAERTRLWDEAVADGSWQPTDIDWDKVREIGKSVDWDAVRQIIGDHT